MYIAIDQHENVIRLGKYPRKELQERFGGRITRMYQDDQRGNPMHVGYVVGNHWFDVYKLTPIGAS